MVYRRVERKNLRKRYQMELVMALTGKSRAAIRKGMQRLGLAADTSGFAEYLRRAK